MFGQHYLGAGHLGAGNLGSYHRSFYFYQSITLINPNTISGVIVLTSRTHIKQEFILFMNPTSISEHSTFNITICRPSGVQS